MQRILQARKYLEEAGIQEADLEALDAFSIKDMYVKLIGNFQVVDWWNMLRNNMGSAKCLFIPKLAALRRIDYWNEGL